MKLFRLTQLILIAAILAGCGMASDRGFTETESGLKYKFHLQADGQESEIDDILRLTMVYRLKDSILFDTRMAHMPMFLELMEPVYPGDIYEGLALMSVGDSATFILDAEDFFVYTIGMPSLPPFIESGSRLYFDVLLEAIFDEEGFMEEQQRLAEEEMLKNEERALAEEGLRLDYLAEEGIQIEALESGLYYIEQEAGTGEKAQAGDMVAVHYEGRLLDGTVFDSSHDRGEPIEFTLGRGQVIPGWDEGISLMRTGGKARLVIPSHLAYGDRGAGQMIPPYATLVFDVELVDIR